MLRTSVIKAIREVLEGNGFFVADDFEIRDAEQPYKISYRHRERLSFAFHYMNKSTAYIEVSPGTVVASESMTADTFRALLDQISQWLSRIRVDLEAEPAARAWNAHRSVVEDLMGRVDDLDDDVHFTQTEVAAMKERLDRVERDLENQIRKQAASDEDAKVQIARLHQEMEGLQAQMAVFSKKTWLRSALWRMLSWGAKKENQDFLIDAAKTAGRVISAVKSDVG